MRGPLPFAFLAAVLNISAFADVYQVTKITIAGHESVSAYYAKGHKVRSENWKGSGFDQVFTISDLDHRVMYAVDPRSRTYMEMRFSGPDLLVSLAQLIARPPRLRESGRTVNVYYDVTDTGETEQFFGRTARHLFVRERHVAQPGACDGSYEVNKDGWYIDSMAPQARSSYFLVAGRIGSSLCRDTIISHGSPPPGIAVWERDGDATREVLEFSNAPLQESLFQIPTGFKKVDAVPGYPHTTWSTQMQLEWAQLVWAVESWFE
ncbi:MAG: hypothetical protein JO061_18625 [Acidobacteriaceae bacterium]|nr:hypothetical protein [Acidobacteriaceae bacterium]